MNNESLIKGLIAFFTIIFIVLATFVYGNLERSKQKSASNTKQAQVLPVSENSKTNSTTTTNPSSANQNIVVTPTSSPVKNTPTTGAGDNIIPMTILSVLGYMLFRSRKRLALVVKSEDNLI